MTQLVTEYNNHFKARKRYLIIFSFLLIFLTLFSLYVGAISITGMDFFKALVGQGEEFYSFILWHLRFMRIFAAITSGMALGLAGLIIQSLLENPLASPTTLGISQGAAFGASFVIIFLGSSLLLVPIGAFIGAIGVTFLLLLLGKVRNLNTQTLILGGVAISSLFVAATIFIQYFADELEIAAAIFWTFGDVARSTFWEVMILLILTLLGALFFMLKSTSLNAMLLGEEQAKTLGVNSSRLRLQSLLIATFLVAYTTSIHGVIAFLGLIAPHITKRILGGHHFFVIPGTMLIAAILLLLSDTLGRIFFESSALPVGVLTSFLGAPLFFYLLLKGEARA